MLLKILLPCLQVLRLSDSNKTGIDKVLYYYIMKNIFIIKSSSDLDNKELFPVSGSSSQKVWILSYSDTEEEENMDTDGPESSDSDILEILSFSVCKLCQKRQLHINAYFCSNWMDAMCYSTHSQR